tara:strand:+ start:3865 stop:4422 length:558 start_codon:yes stop_codon:yes gene_type:complete
MDPENPYAPPAAEVVPTGSPDTELGNAERSRLEHLHQEAAIRAFGCLGLCSAVGSVWLVMFLGFGGLARTGGGWVVGIAVGVPVVVVGLFVIGLGLLRLKPWSRLPGGVLALVSLPFVPSGTLLGGILLWLLTSAKGREVLSPSHEAVRERTRHVKPWPLTIVIFFSLLLVSTLGVALLVSLFLV